MSTRPSAAPLHLPARSIWMRVAGLAACLVLCGAITALSSARDDRIPVNAGTDSGVELYAPTERDGFSFVVFGDRTGGDSTRFAVMDEGIRMTNRLDPEFVMTEGDLVEGYCDGGTWMNEVRELKEHLSVLGVPWFPVVGNHDVYGGQNNKELGNVALYQEHVGPLYYSFDYRWAHFVALFSDEMLSFANPAVDQNISKEQLDWLREDLASTDATQIFVFLHHPRWTYQGTNWPDVHELLRQDGRTKAIIAGHFHTWRDEGVRDGIHYHILGSTGGAVGALKESVHAYQIAHVRVRDDGYTMSFIPTGSVHGSDLVTTDELYAMGPLTRGGWVSVAGRARLDVEHRVDSELSIEVHNPTDRAVDFGFRLDQGGDWTWRIPTEKVHLEPGEIAEVLLGVGSPPFDGRTPRVAFEVSLDYPLQSGVIQPIRTTLALPFVLEGATAAAREAPDANRVLKVDGRSGIRVPLSERFERLTLECWARGLRTRDWRGIASKQQSSGFGLTVSEGRIAGSIMVEGSDRYVQTRSTTELEESEWMHYAFVWDGAQTRLYVNGILEGENSAPGPLTDNSLPFFVGADTDGNGNPQNPFVGEIDEVRLSRSVRYAGEFEPPFRHEPDDETVLLLHFDRAFGAAAGPGVFPDASGNDHHGWPVGSPRLVEGGP